jgi:LDH2 family malate/lactate/ureidoglycolate dehydrogenase
VRCVNLRRVDYVKPWRSGAVLIEKATDEPSRVIEKPSPLVIDADNALKSSLKACTEALRANAAKSATVAAAVRTMAYLIFLGLVMLAAVHIVR